MDLDKLLVRYLGNIAAGGCKFDKQSYTEGHHFLPLIFLHVCIAAVLSVPNSSALVKLRKASN